MQPVFQWLEQGWPTGSPPPPPRCAAGDVAAFDAFGQLRCFPISTLPGGVTVVDCPPDRVAVYDTRAATWQCLVTEAPACGVNQEFVPVLNRCAARCAPGQTRSAEGGCPTAGTSAGGKKSSAGAIVIGALVLLGVGALVIAR